MFGFKNKLKALAMNWSKGEHTPLAKAVVAAGIFIAAADGNIDEDEVQNIKDIIAGKENLKAFVPEASVWADDYALLITKSAYTGKLELLRIIGAIRADRAAAENVLTAALDIAAADGKVDESEQKAIAKVAETLGLNVRDFL